MTSFSLDTRAKKNLEDEPYSVRHLFGKGLMFYVQLHENIQGSALIPTPVC